MTLGYLLRLGLSIESIPFRSREIHLDAKDGGKVTSQIVKDDNVRTVARFCFRPRDDAAKQAIVGDAFLCGPEAARKFFQDAKTETDQSPVVEVPRYVVDKLVDIVDAANAGQARRRSDRDFDDDPERVKDNLRAFKRKNVRIELTTRSTPGHLRLPGLGRRRDREGGTPRRHDQGRHRGAANQVAVRPRA